MSLKKDFYFLSPVEVVRVSSSNLAEVAEWCGGKVAQTESRRVPGRMDSYVWVPTPKGTALSWAFPGMFITKRLVRTVKDELRVTYAVFRRDYFEKNYFESPNKAVTETWEKGYNTPNVQAEPEQPRKKKGKKQYPYMSAEERKKAQQQVVNETGEEIPVPVTIEDAVQVLKDAGLQVEQVNPDEEDTVIVEEHKLSVEEHKLSVEEEAAQRDAQVQADVQAIQKNVVDPKQVELEALRAIQAAGQSDTTK